MFLNISWIYYVATNVWFEGAPVPAFKLAALHCLCFLLEVVSKQWLSTLFESFSWHHIAWKQCFTKLTLTRLFSECSRYSKIYFATNNFDIHSEESLSFKGATVQIKWGLNFRASLTMRASNTLQIQADKQTQLLVFASTLILLYFQKNLLVSASRLAMFPWHSWSLT